MKNILCIVLLAGSLAAQAQPGSNTLLSHIPADADKAVQVNLGGISSKIDWLSIASLVKDRNLGSHNAMKMEDMMAFINSGVDFHRDVVITTSNAYNPDSTKYITILVHLTDSGKFATLIRTRGGNDIRMLHPGGKDRVAVEKGNATAWNDHLAVVVIANRPKTESSDPITPQLQNRIGHRAIAALHGFGNTYFVSDPRFTAAFSDNGDLHLWNRHSGAGLGSMNKLLGDKAGAQMNAFAQLASHMSHDATLGTLRFDAGKLTYHSQKILTPEERSAMERISSPSFSSDLIAAIPPGNLMVLLTTHYNMPAWIDSLSRWPLTAMLTGKLQEKNVTLDDFGHALKGSFLVLVYAPDRSNPAADTGARAKTPVIYVAATVADKAAFDRLAAAIDLKNATQASTGTPADEPDTSNHHHSPFRYYAVSNGMAVIGATRDQVSAFFDHPAANAANGPAARLLTDAANSNTMTISMDLHAFADFLTPLLTKDDTLSAKNRSVLDALRKIDVLQWSAGALRDGVQETNIELRFTDQNKNALASLMDILGSLSAKKEQP